MISSSKLPLKGVVICLFITFVFTTAFTILETTCPLYTSKWYGFSDWNNSLLFLGISIGCLLSLFILQLILLMITDERIILITCSLFVTVGLIVLFDWNNTSVSLVRFYCGLGLVSFGYANGQAILISIFSKILEEQEQGIMMGWFSSVGCIARMIIPVVACYIFDLFSISYIFLTVAALSFLCICSSIFTWKAIDTEEHNI